MGFSSTGSILFDEEGTIGTEGSTPIRMLDSQDGATPSLINYKHLFIASTFANTLSWL